MLVISNLTIRKESKYSRRGEKIEIENAVYITLNCITIINIKIQIEISLRITPRKISKHTEDSQRIYNANRMNELHMMRPSTKGNLQTDYKFSRTVKISLKTH